MSNRSRGRLVVREVTKKTKKDIKGKQGEYVDMIDIRTEGAFGKPNYQREEKRSARRQKRAKIMKVELGLLCSDCGEITGKAYGRPTLCEKCTIEFEKTRESTSSGN